MSGLLVFLGGLSGALGVALSALASHYPGGEALAPAAQMLLVHSPAFLALAALAALAHGKTLPGWALASGALLLACGLALFAGDLSRRVFAGERLFHWAAPLGGSLMIGSWAWFALAGAFSLFKRTKAD